MGQLRDWGRSRMNLEELKERLKSFEDSEIRITPHAHKRIQDKRRNLNYSKILYLIKSQQGLYKFQEQPAKNKGESKFKLWFRLNYLYDMNIYIVMNVKIKEKGLNRLEIISAHKVKRQIQEKLENANKD